MLNLKLGVKEIIRDVLALLKRAATDKKHPMHFMILGSVNKYVPEMRYVVWRSFDAVNISGNIYTDLRSDKIKQLEENPLAQLLFYDRGKKCQIKVNVRMFIHNKTSETETVYKQMQRGMEAYNTLNAPGTPFEKYEHTLEMKPEYNSADFVILEAKFLSMEVLQLQEPHHVRFSYDFEREEFVWLVP